MEGRQLFMVARAVPRRPLVAEDADKLVFFEHLFFLVDIDYSGHIDSLEVHSITPPLPFHLLLPSHPPPRPPTASSSSSLGRQSKRSPSSRTTFLL